MNFKKKVSEMLVSKPEAIFLLNLLFDPLDIKRHSQQYKKRRRSDLIKQSYGRKAKIRYVPPSFHIYITFRCNLRCSYCQWLLQDKDAFDNAPTMSVLDFNRILDKFGKDIGTIALQGGEPTAHPEFSEIVTSAKSKNFRLKMSTNGTLIKERINDLKSIDDLNISLNGLDYESFERTTNGTRKQFDKMMSGIDLLNAQKIPFTLSYVLFEENLSKVQEVIQFAKQVKPTFLNFSPGNAHGSSSLTSLVSSSPAVKHFLAEFISKDDFPFSIHLPLILNPGSETFKKEICQYPWNKVYISPTGDISYCCHLPFNPEIGNIFKGYHFNSQGIINFRKSMIAHHLSEDCLFCHRRFRDNSAATFDSTHRKWILPPDLSDDKISKEGKNL
ncbi:MAG: radical SAM protein [Dehalococcoidia bacterium]|nr:MAG: radical SAM protein [Dehalococcoidia bacterium]